MGDLARMHNRESEYPKDKYPKGNPDWVETGICNTARRIISRSKQFAYVRKEEDLWNFVPHYPYPRDDGPRRWAVGMQAGGDAAGLAKFNLLVHVTHAVSNAGGSTEQFVLSNSVHTPVYRVMLWYSNPFHFYTGFVEASISNGGDSQRNVVTTNPDGTQRKWSKFLGGEHPMWLVSAKSPFLSDRNGYAGVGMIDGFFDNWLPIFVHECRFLGRYDHNRIHEGMEDDAAKTEAKEYADKMYQEMETIEEYDENGKMIAQQSVSVPDARIGRHLYVDADGKPIDKVSIQQHQKEEGLKLFTMYMDMNEAALDAEQEEEKEVFEKTIAKARDTLEMQRSRSSMSDEELATSDANNGGGSDDTAAAGVKINVDESIADVTIKVAE